MDLGNPVEFTIAEMAKLAFWITYSPSRIVGQPLPQDDPSQRQRQPE